MKFLIVFGAGGLLAMSFLILWLLAENARISDLRLAAALAAFGLAIVFLGIHLMDGR